MRVVVIGHRGAGKTALIASGIAGLRQLAGSQVRMSPPDRWRVQRTARQVAAGRPVPATRSARVIALTLAGDTRPALTVAIHDQAGDAVGSADRPPARRLAADLAAADALIVVISAADLGQPGVRLSRCRTLAVPVRRAAAPRDAAARLRAVAVAVTGVAEDRDGALADLAAPFDGLETSMSALVAGATIGLSRGLAPLPAALPLLWCISRWAAGSPGPAAAAWQDPMWDWCGQAWQAAGPGRYAWPPPGGARRVTRWCPAAAGPAARP